MQGKAGSRFLSSAARYRLVSPAAARRLPKKWGETHGRTES